MISQAPTTGCAAFCDLTGILLGYVIYDEYSTRYVFCCSMLLYEYVPIFRRLIDEAHAQRH